MNYLAHLYLADYSGTSAAGSVLGDHVRGRLDGRFPAAIERGIRLHRAVDSYTDAHPAVQAAVQRFEPPLRRYAGICTDIYFDHLLARDWETWHTQSLGAFAQSMRKRMAQEWPHPPFTARGLDGLAETLCAAGQPQGVVRALLRVDARARRTTPLRDALPVLRAQDAQLQADFSQLFPDLRDFVRAKSRDPED